MTHLSDQDPVFTWSPLAAREAGKCGHYFESTWTHKNWGGYYEKIGEVQVVTTTHSVFQFCSQQFSKFVTPFLLYSSFLCTNTNHFSDSNWP